MDLRRFIKPELIMTDVEAADKWVLMERMLDNLVENLPERYVKPGSRKAWWNALKKREERESTALGRGIILPHARIPRFGYLAICLAVTREPIECDAMDGSPVRIAVMIIASEETPGMVLKVYSLLARLLSDTETRRKIEEAPDAATIFNLVQDHELNMDITMTAAEMMKPPFFLVRPDDLLPNITHKMAHFREPAIAVVDKKGMMVGEITSDRVFQFGMPEFFNQLQSVSFVRNFNPLEKYFMVEEDSRAKDLMEQDYAWVPPDATLIEVIFQLSVKKHTKVYVIDQGKLVGVIGRMNVLDRAVNF